MNTLLLTLNNSLPIFSTIAAVLFLRKQKVLKPEFASSLSPLIFKLVLPIFAFKVIYGLNFNLSDGPILFYVWAANLFLLPIIVLASKLTKLSKPLTGTLLLLSLAYSVGPVAYPFVQLNFPPDVFAKVVSIDIVLFVTIMVLGPVLASIYDQSIKSDFREIVKSVVTDPVLIAVILGGTFNFLGVKLPTSIVDSAQYIGGSFTFLVTVFVGLTLKLPNLSRATLLFSAMIFRFITAVGITLLVHYFLRPSKEMALAIPLTLFMAFSAFPLVYTDKHKLDSEFVAQASIFSRILVYILYPLLITLLKSI